MYQALNEKAVAELMCVAVQTLRNWRHLGKGPPYLKIERCIRYRLNDLHDFLSDRRIEPEKNIFINKRNKS